MSTINNKLLVILGPTSSGKTNMAVELALKFNGEIISADSRQVYRGMDIGTGKDLKEYAIKSKGKIIKIPYHLIDVAYPNKIFNLAKFKKLAERAIEDIQRRGKLPILVGGSGLYLQAVVDNYQLSRAVADKKLRKELENKTSQFLYKELAQLNKKFADKLNNSDRHNKRRLIRYIEIHRMGFMPNINNKAKFNCLVIGITRPKKELDKRIRERLLYRLEKEDMIGEVKKLNKAGVSWKRLEEFGLEYRYISRYLKKEISYDQMFEGLNRAIKRFARKQLTWCRRWERQGKIIHWLSEKKQAEIIIKRFIK